MDVDLSQSITANKEADNDKWQNYNQLMGIRMSMMEHAVPERLFLTEENKVEAISAVKALSLAIQQGQKIYQIKSENINSLQNLNISQSIKNEIKNAVLSGKEATVSESNIDFNGWNGVGYLIIDPSTGAGAYKISGGSDGSNIAMDVSKILLNTLSNELDIFISPANAASLTPTSPNIDACLTALFSGPYVAAILIGALANTMKIIRNFLPLGLSGVLIITFFIVFTILLAVRLLDVIYECIKSAAAFRKFVIKNKFV